MQKKISFYRKSRGLLLEPLLSRHKTLVQLTISDNIISTINLSQNVQLQHQFAVNVHCTLSWSSSPVSAHSLLYLCVSSAL